jgi:hypothetical protein
MSLSMATKSLFVEYSKRLEAALQAGSATEHTHRAALQSDL